MNVMPSAGFWKRVGDLVYFGFNSSIVVFMLFMVSALSTWLVKGLFDVQGVDLQFPTNFVFQPCAHAGVCSYPSATVSLQNRDSPYDIVLTAGLPYTASLKFRVADSEMNRAVGMFLVHFSLVDEGGRPLSTCATSTSIPYRSKFVRTIRRFFAWPLMVSNFVDEYYSLDITCPEPLTFRDDQIPIYARVELQSLALQISNGGSMELSAHLTGLRYIFYRWPMTSTCLLFLVIFWLSMTVTFMAWLIKSAAAALSEQPPKRSGREPVVRKERLGESKLSTEDFREKNEDQFCYQRRPQLLRNQDFIGLEENS